MDINSLLSPQDTPQPTPTRETPSPLIKGPTRKPRKPRASGQAQRVSASPLSNATLPPPSLPHDAVVSAQQNAKQAMLSPSSISPGSTSLPGSASLLRRSTSASSTMTPPASIKSSVKVPPTSGMDTLADLASMQHHQQAARTNATTLRNSDVYDSQHSPATVLSTLHTMPKTQPPVPGVKDINMTDAPPQTLIPRPYTSTSLSRAEVETVNQLSQHLIENSYAYETHVQLVKVLHKGLISHIEATKGDARSYDLLPELLQAREAMDARFALGEELWVERLEDEGMLSATVEDCVAVVEAYEKAVSEEKGSTKLWLMYGKWMLSLYSAAHGIVDDRNATVIANQLWSEGERLVAQEVFSRHQVLEILKRGTQETRYMIHDSHEIWDMFNGLLLEDLAESRQPEEITVILSHFMNRLNIPHATWEQTFQTFSTFVSTYDNSAYEQTMVAANHHGSDAKTKYGMREALETKLRKEKDAGDMIALWNTYKEYLDWELGQGRRKKGNFDVNLVNALYQRAVIQFPTDTTLWEDYVIFLTDETENHNHPTFKSLPVLGRATRHCPWSGLLWAQNLQAAERDELPFDDIGQIKHKATSTGLLDAGGLEEILKVHVAWCGFLRRRAFDSDSTDEDLDVAEVGIRSAIEDMETLGRQKYGEDYKGDPRYRLERIYIKYLGQALNWQGARDTWKGLVHRHGDSYEFWMRYYNWEMVTWGQCAHGQDARAKMLPMEATRVLSQAIKRTNMDWPEKIVETYLYHCEEHEGILALHHARVQCWKTMKIVDKRRVKEAEEAAIAQQQQVDAGAAVTTETMLMNGKRKRDEKDDEPDAIAKKNRSEAVEQRNPSVEDHVVAKQPVMKRDRENATVIVKNLPVDVTETRVRQYFRDCGTINSLKLFPEDDSSAATATIEFDSKEDVLTAQTKDMKTLDGRAIEVQVGLGSTLFVTNFPPTADEGHIKDLFSKYGEIVDVRFPSLKYDTHRRFCYVQFKASNQAQAATALNDHPVSEKLKLVAKISDPAHKQDRTGALYEGREVYVSNVDWSATTDELGKIFSKYGKVEKVRIPTNIAGKSKGMAFLVFSTKDEANAALDMNLTKYKTRLLYVTLSTANPAKRQATSVITKIPRNSSTSPSASPQPPSQGHMDTHMNGASESASSPPKHELQESTNLTKPLSAEIQSRTLALLHVPDTINDTRLRALCESHGGAVKQLKMRPDHGGAIVEFVDVSSAGKASLGLDGIEIVPGRSIGVGSVGQLLREKGERKHERGFGADGGAKQGKETAAPDEDKAKRALQGSTLVKRPPGQGGRGGRGGLGYKHAGATHHVGGGNGNGKTKEEATDGVNGVGTSTSGEVTMKEDVNSNTDDVGAENSKPKSNADFKAMFLKS